MSGWSDWIFGNLPLQPVLGDPIDPSYQRMPRATANIEDRRTLGPSNWASRPHDQDLQSRNMMGYYRPLVGDELDAYSWQKNHGWLNRALPTTPLPDPDFIPADPSIVARTKAAEDQKYADQTAGAPTPPTSMPFSPQQLQNMLQYWQAGRQ